MNRKIAIMTAGVLITILLAAGCANKNAGASPSGSATPPTSSAGTPEPSGSPSASPDASPSAGTAVSEDEQKTILDAFQTLLKTPGSEKAALIGIKKDITKLSPENADKMLLAFETYQSEAVSKTTVLSDDLLKQLQALKTPYDEKTLNDPSKITDANLKNALQDVLDKGYTIIVPEGMYEAVINYGVYKDAKTSVTPDLAAYIDIMAKESESRTLEDAAIIIPMDEVFARALASESFILTYPDSVKYDQIHQKYSNYVDTLFFGQNNTPAFDYITKKLNQEFLDSYQKAAGGKDTPLVKAVADYLKVLKDNGNTLTATVTEYRDSMTKTLKNSAS